ncbi:IS1/IS1595 family N-terminal zinc-binding domain-containing protein, partial [Aquamicrobium soli]
MFDLPRRSPLECPRCHSEELRKTGPKAGAQRYCCRSCGRYCTDRPRR